MRMHVELDDDLIAQVDRLVGSRGRSRFVCAAVERAVRQEIRWSATEATAGGIDDQGHDWDVDPAEWVREQRRADTRRAG
jgi:Arc/MetJ family transcription regulator